MALTLAAAGAAQNLTGSLGTVIPSPISTSVTLTAAESPWVINGDVYVLAGATLTVQPGVTLRSSNGTLAITRGADIVAVGTQDAPITWTSNLDNGTYRAGVCQEWGNLTIMGRAYVNTCRIPTNTAAPSASNFADMEGLFPANTSLNDYGGNDDNDDSGSLAYCSFRYGGRAVANGDELNGLSLGAIGRETDIHHVEVLANVDDGIEIWGGTVNLKYISIWNVGDDSFDIDQGWRGKAQFGLIVQGYSCQGGSASQGSGFGDNAIEMDGAEQCNWQPVTTARLANFTVIGSTPQNPNDSTAGDDLVELRDNCRVQFLNCIFMDGGDNVFDDAVSDNEACNQTANCASLVPSSLARCQTSASTFYATNPFAAPEISPAQAYQAQNPAGNQIEYRGCLFFNNIRPQAYIEAAQNFIINPGTGVSGGGGTNHANNAIVTSSPIQSLTRAAFFSPNGTNNVAPVTFCDPTPANAALNLTAEFPTDGAGFFSEARFAGAFAPGNNWLVGWSAVSQYGLTTSSRANDPILGIEVAGAGGDPAHGAFNPTTGASSTWATGSPVTLSVFNAGPASVSLVVFSEAPANPAAPLAGLPVGFLGLGPQVLIPSVDVLQVAVGAGGTASLPTFTMPAGFSGRTFYSQAFPLDIGTITSSGAQRHIVP